MKIGGRCPGLWIPESRQNLLNGIKYILDSRLKFKVISGGTNLLINDGRLNFIVIGLFAGEFRDIKIEDGFLKVGAGVRFNEAIDFCLKNSISGLEFLAGVPACIGGGLANNFSFQKNSLGRLAERIGFVDSAGLRLGVLPGRRINFSRHSSSLKHSSYIITEVWLKIKEAGRPEIKQAVKENILCRLAGQDLKNPSLGCVFKNPAGDVSAGELIEQCGLKGFRIGNAQVSVKHANFIVNKGGARFSDVASLIRHVKEKVFQDSGVVLEEEIEIWQ